MPNTSQTLRTNAGFFHSLGKVLTESANSPGNEKYLWTLFGLISLTLDLNVLNKRSCTFVIPTGGCLSISIISAELKSMVFS